MKKHICFIIPSLGLGGAQRVVSVLANHLIEKGYRISIVLLINDVIYPIDSRIELVLPDFELRRNIGTFRKVIQYYRRSIKSIKPDVIFSFQEFYNEIAMLSLTGIRKKIFLFDRNNPFLKEQNYLQFILRKIYYPQADGLVVQTKNAAQFMRQRGFHKNILVLPNPLSDITLRWNENNIEKSIICVGRIEKQKNHKYLIDLFSEINHQGWVLKIIGEGSYKNQLIEYVKFLKLDQDIKFLGYQENIQKFLAESTIFAFPSLWEGYPNALLEAQAVGIPCVSNNCPTGPSDLIQDGINGFLIEIGDTDNFKKKLTLLMQDAELRKRISKEAQKVKEEHSITLISEKLEKFVFDLKI